jgi:hypothetical protein
MRTIDHFRAELITDLDVSKGIDFLVGIRVRHVNLGEGRIVKVNNDWDLCTAEFTETERWMEFYIDEFAMPECGWDFDLKQLDQIFAPHMLKVRQQQ